MSLFEKRLEVVRALLTAGTKANQANKMVETALTLAVIENHQPIYALLKMWQTLLQSSNKTLLENIIAILKTSIQIPKTISLFFSTDLLDGFLAELEAHSANKEELGKETLIKMLENNRSRIPTKKYKFILNYLLVAGTIQSTLNTSEQRGRSLSWLGT